ncbi:MAG: metalloregulator ArsR/SmtB family transcription factor [Chloroflexota bacterium]
MVEEPTLQWELATGYDFVTSLDVLHHPDRYGLRGSWAAGVRSRLPVEQRETLQTFFKSHNFLLLPWLISLNGPKDSLSVLENLSEIPPAERLPTFLENSMWVHTKNVLLNVAHKQSFSEEDIDELRQAHQAYMKEQGIKKKLATADIEESLTIWAQSEKFGDGLLNGLKTYYEVFFSEEEKRILPALEDTVEYAKSLSEKMDLEPLLNALSQGVRFELPKRDAMKTIVMVPSFWTTPLALLSHLDANYENWVFMFGGRPANRSLVPGETVPELLHQTLKALADPTRLRILRYLAQEPLAPAELARRLRLRPPTVIHHLDALRLARLVHVTINHEGRRYEARREAIDSACSMLNQFLDG